MKIHLSNNDLSRLKTLFETKENNIQVSEMMCFLLQNINSFNRKEIEEYKKEYNCSLEEAYFHYAIDLWELDFDNEENQKIFNNYLIDAFKEVKEDDYKNNPYYQTIKIKNFKNDQYHLFYDHYHAYEPYSLDDITVNKNKHYLEETKFGFFKNDFHFICLNKNDVTWMSITPNEINTMKSSIDHARGNVLVLGLGLGYFPFMISLKNDVKFVQIIEKDRKIIDIFKKEILPLFPQKEKIKITCGDAFDYLNTSNNSYDFCYVDLYHNPADGLPIYLRLKNSETKFNISSFEYWLETGILAYLRRLIIIVMQESIEGLDDKCYSFADNDEDRIINKIYSMTKNKVFSSYDDIFSFLDDASLVRFIESWK